MADIPALIYEVVDEINGQLPADNQLQKAPDTVIIGDGSTLDSLGVVNFLVSLEEKMTTSLGQSVSLLNDDLLEHDNGSARTIDWLGDYIAREL